MKKILVTVLILAVAGGGVYYWKYKKAQSKEEKFKPVTVDIGTITISVLATGVVQPQNRLEIKPPIAGRIESLLVKEGDRVKKGQILAWLSSTERAALLDAARAQGEQEAARWESVYKPAPLVAPMNGVIIARNMEPGQTISVQEAPLVMSDRLVVKAQVDETDIGQVSTGLQTEVTLDAYPDRKIGGHVDRIAYEAKTVNNVTIYEVEVVTEKIPPFMRAGMTANITFVVERKEDVLTVPQEAVRERDGVSQVFVPSEDEKGKGRPRKKQIETGLSDGKRVEVVDGLEEGDTVLVPDFKMEKKGNNNQASNPLNPMGGRRPGGGGGRR